MCDMYIQQDFKQWTIKLSTADMNLTITTIWYENIADAIINVVIVGVNYFSCND
jgi:hypothetical protein